MKRPKAFELRMAWRRGKKEMNGIRANLFAENSVHLFFYRAPARDEKAEGLWIAHGLTYREEIETRES